MTCKEWVLERVPEAFCVKRRKNGVYRVALVGFGVSEKKVFCARSSRDAWSAAYHHLKWNLP